MLVMALGTWAKLLEHIPTERIDEYFVKASRRKTNGFAVNANDIIAAWNAEPPERYPGAPPEGYSFARDATGAFKPLGRDPVTGALPWGGDDILEDNAREEEARREYARRRHRNGALTAIPQGARGAGTR